MLRQGDPGSTVILILSGRAKVVYSAPDGTETLLSIRGPGDVIGEMACTTDEPRSATVQALEPVDARVIPFGEFTDLVKQFSWGVPLQRYWVDRLRQACQLTWRIPAQSPQRKIAALFVALLETGNTHSVPMTQQEIADMFGLSRRTVGEVLRQWQRHGFILVRRSRMEIIEPGRIRSMLPYGM